MDPSPGCPLESSVELDKDTEAWILSGPTELEFLELGIRHLPFYKHCSRHSVSRAVGIYLACSPGSPETVPAYRLSWVKTTHITVSHPCFSYKT